ncbi:hypothetical protein [Nocardia sp. XZ_19_385]|uniref:hypothetical protein n=1 Tax=Nocardia sp. XZ_19_385 TaxID=2769488 RepID=UPI001E6525DD|nr:hypothetical protein [Nocardia sp. XZ_19_385]
MVDDRLIAAHADGRQIRPEWYTDEFQRIAKAAGLRRIQLKGLRNTSVSLMLALGSQSTSWRPGTGTGTIAMSLSVYSDTHTDDLKAAGAALYS